MFDNLNPLPWPPLELPDYKEATMGDWKVTKKNIPLLRGYFHGLQPLLHPNWILAKGKTLWMSLTPMELESQAPHAAAAYGHTVIMGFGMGVLAYNVLKNPDVTKVTVIELEPDTVKLIEKSADLWHWPGAEKLRIVYADALEWTPDEAVDVVLADIWPNLGDENLRPDMQKIYNNTNPTRIAGWGMELDYVDWMHVAGYEPGDEDQDTYCEYVDEIGLPLIEQGNDYYPALALDAARNVVLY